LFGGYSGVEVLFAMLLLNGRVEWLPQSGVLGGVSRVAGDSG